MNNPTHEEISQLAHKIWQDTGDSVRGADADWLDAERQLHASAAKSKPDSPAPEHAASHTLSESKSPVATAERAALQKKEARQPKLPTHTGPKSTPPESGKPLWNQPHSS
jgi:hypothetical protein